MEFDHIHFYVQDAERSRNWFVNYLGFQSLGSLNQQHTQTEIVNQGSVYFLLSSPLTHHSPVYHYLQAHPSGVADVAFQVRNLESWVESLIEKKVTIISPLQTYQYGGDTLKWLTIQGWGELRHTLIEQTSNLSGKIFPNFSLVIPQSFSDLLEIDHVVLNVNKKELVTAVNWYQDIFRFIPKQAFDIQTDRSGLHSQVLVHPQGTVQFPINEPASENSQIQEFLNLNNGAGVQHIALKTHNIIQQVQDLKQRGLSFLNVPSEYYNNIKERWFSNSLLIDWESLEQYEILVDWEEITPEAMLLQIFTQTIFEQPTFFFEFIERKTTRFQGKIKQAQGFGEGNFKALFEAIEREQIKRENQ